MTAERGGQMDVMAELCRVLEAEKEAEGLLQRVVDAAVREVPGAEYAGVTVVNRRGASTPGFSHELVIQIDALQYESGQGPCLDAASFGTPVVRTDDLQVEGRWPLFGPAAAALGVRSMLSFQLFVKSTNETGALNLYSRTIAAFGEESERVGSPLATHTALAMRARRERADLRAAVENRDVIGQAKGILMERHKVSAAQAFDLLLTASNHMNMKLREVARSLTETGELVESPNGKRNHG